jgi:hypothetical protein
VSHRENLCRNRLGRGVNRGWAPAFSPRIWRPPQPKRIRRIGEQLDKGLSNPWRDVHHNVPTVKLVWMRQTARVSDHLEVPLER